jgi:hypothetical protein
VSDDAPSIELWGWTLRSGGSARNRWDEWHPKGDRIGWVDGADIFLEPDTAYAMAQRLAADGGDSLGVTRETLYKRLVEGGFVMSHDPNRHTLRKVVAGARRRVLHLRAQLVISGLETQDSADDESSGPLSGPAFGDNGEKRSTETPQNPREKQAKGPDGPDGPLLQQETSIENEEMTEWRA